MTQNVIIAMGSVTEAAREAIDYLVAQGEKVGLVSVHLYRHSLRNISCRYFQKQLNALLYWIVLKNLVQRANHFTWMLKMFYMVKQMLHWLWVAVMVLGSKDTTPAQILAVYENLALPMPKNLFTIGIEDDVTFTSLPHKEKLLWVTKVCTKLNFMV